MKKTQKLVIIEEERSVYTYYQYVILLRMVGISFCTSLKTYAARL